MTYETEQKRSSSWVLGRMAPRAVAVVTIVIFSVVLLFLILNWYIAPVKPSEKKDLVLALAQILGGTALLSGLYFTWRTLRVNREGQVTDRFTSAIDQLGKMNEENKPQFEVRIGGIYALERISKDKEFEKDYYWPIMEVLTSYVRHNGHWPHGKVQSMQEMRELVEGGLDEEEILPGRPQPDIQAIMFVLRRRARSYDSGEPEPLDLRDANLVEADLREAKLEHAYLFGTYLVKARLQQARLARAKLWDARLWAANLTGAGLIGADLTGAQLWKAQLKDARLIGAILNKADFRKADLSGANLGLAKLEGANFGEATLRGANLSSAKNLQTVNLAGAHVEGANLSYTGLTQPQLEETTGDRNSTRLPDGLDPPAHWGAETDEQDTG